MPFLRFHADEQLRKELDMLSLLDQVHKENEELDRKRAGLTQESSPDSVEAPSADEDTAMLGGHEDAMNSDEGQRKEDSF